METQTQAEKIVLAFTDVVDSVEWTVKYPRDFEEAQDAHRALIREELAKWEDGTEVNTTGDGFLLMFRIPLNAARWAKETQRRMLQRPWPSKLPLETRIGLHWGTPRQTIHLDGRVDLDGEPVNYANRVMSMAGGGEIFVSEDFYAQARQELPQPFEFYALGRREAKGYGQLPVWQLRHSDLPSGVSQPECLSNLPFPPNSHFYGREEFMAELRTRLLASKGAAVALTGMGGSGKTQVALEYAHRHLSDYPGGVYWLDARSEERLLADYAAIGRRFFGRSEAVGAEEAAEQTREALRRLKKPALVIFDNVAEQSILRWLPASGPLHLLLTTQRQVLRAGVLLMEPPRLSETAALKLLQVFRSPADEKDRNAAGEIVRTVGSLPLALALASHHIRALGCSFPEYLLRLKGAPFLTMQTGRDYFKTATGHVGSIYDTIALAVQDEDCGAETTQRGVNEDALKILAAAACFASGSISNDLLFQTSGLRSQEKFDNARLSLWGRSLLTREQNSDAEGRQFVHELVREYARLELLPSRRRTLLPRAVRVLTERLRRANQALEWGAVRSDMAHCYAVAAAQTKTPLPEMTELLLEIGVYLAEHRDCKTALKYYADGMKRLRPSENGLFRAKFLRLMGEAQQENDEAAALRHVRQAWRIARRELPKDAPEMADYCNSMGYVLKMRGRLKRALPFYLRALHLHQGKPEVQQSDVAALFNNIGNLLEAQGDLSGAQEQFQCALAAAEQAGGSENILIAYCLNNAGRALGKMQRWPEALERHERARKISEAAQGARHPNTAACWFYIAEAQRGLGRRREARAHYRRAKQIYEEKLGPNNIPAQRTSERLASLEAGDD